MSSFGRVIGRRPLVVASMLVVSLASGACSGSASFSIGGRSIQDAATELIENDLAEAIELGALDADCPDVDDGEVGTEFDCTATAPDGAIVEVHGVVDSEDHINVVTTNVLLAGDLPRLEAAGVDVINTDAGATIDAAAMDCGTASVVLDDTGQVSCTLTDPGDGTVYDVTYTITDLANGAFTLEWAPR